MDVYQSEDYKEALTQEIRQPSFDENTTNFNYKIVSFIHTKTMRFSEKLN